MYRFKGSFVCAALCFATLLAPSLTTTFAQSSFDQKIKDQELADSLKQKTNRTFDGLFEQVKPDGSVSVDLNGRFQNIMLARLGENGHPVVGCVASLNEANGFFGRDLETGARVAQPSWFADKEETEAAAHGMSKQELVFYKKLIERYEDQIALSLSSATITIINNDGAGEGFNDPTAVNPEGGNNGTTLGQQRLNLFNAAAAIWGDFLDSQVNIQVNAQFNPQTCTSNSAVLGSASTTTVHRNFTNAEFPETWYHQALANKRAGADLSANPDINTTFNSNLNGNAGCLGGRRFYLGFDNSTPANTTNLLVVVLHELAHGLGFSDFAGNDGTFFNGFTDIYITHLLDRTTNKKWNEMTDAERAASMINNNNVLWDGGSVKFASSFLTNGRDANGRVEVFTPNPLQGGSSVSHWNQRASPNLLMEPSINLGLPLTLDLTRQQMRDVGWYRDSNGDGTADTITGITPSGNFVLAGSQATINWANNGGFNKNVTIELSTDGGTTFPITVAANIVNTGTSTFTVPSILTNQARIRVRETDYASPAGTSAANFTITNTLPTVKAPFDFDGDGKTEVSIFRPGTGEWWYRRSSDGNVSAAQFGSSTDVVVPGDFSGDGKADLAFWRPTTGEWFILRSEDGSFYSFPFGTTTDVPAPADYDGDGVTDAAVYRPSTNTWFILQSSGGTAFINFGSTGDRPTPADYDGDGKTDIGIFRPASGEWWYLRSSDSSVRAVNFGLASDRAVPGDFSGDGKADQAFFRPSTGEWFVLRSEDASFYSFPFGTAGDIPTPGDYDGDGTMDAAIFRPSSTNWFINASTSGVAILQFGISTDSPIPNAYVR